MKLKYPIALVLGILAGLISFLMWKDNCEGISSDLALCTAFILIGFSFERK